MPTKTNPQPMFRIVVTLVLALFCRLSPAADDLHRPSVREATSGLLAVKRHWSDGGSGPLCGVFSVCHALRTCGYECSPTDYYSADYVGSAHGSTPEQLAAIARTVQAQATIVSGLSAWDLRWLNRPLVANVRSSPSSRQYDHWVVARYHEGRIEVHDRQRPPVQMPIAEFLGIWSGLGVIFSKPGDSGLPDVWLGRAIVLQAGILFVMLLKLLLSSWSAPATNTCRRWMPEAAGIVVVTAAITAVGLIAFGDVPYLSDGIRLATAPYQTSSSRHGTLEELHLASTTGDALLIDARLTGDYQRGSVSGAVNIPVHASVWEMRDYLQQVRRDTPILVFCQSLSCPYDDVVAANLSLLGFHNVTVCDKGWREYRQQYLTEKGRAATARSG